MTNLDDLFRSSPVARGLVDFDTHRFVSVNPEWLRMFGFTLEQVRGRDGAELRLWGDERDRSAYLKSIEHARSTGWQRSRRRRASGEVFEALCSAEEFRFEGVRYRLTTVIDVSAEARANEMARTLAAVFAASPVAHSIVDVEKGVFHDVNAACERMFGIARADFVGRRGRDLGYWPDEAEYQRFVEAVKSDEHGRGYLGRRRRRNGEIFDVRVNWERIELGGRVYRLYAITDITAERAGMRSMEQLSGFFRSSPAAHGISRFDDGVYIDVNEAYAHLVGCTRDEMLGRSSLQLGIWADPRDRAVFQAAALKGRVSDFPARFRRKDGALIDLHLACELLEFDGVRHMLVSFADVTRIVANREALELLVRERTAELEAANRELEAFSYSVSHDMRAPVRAIAGFASILLEDHRGELPPEAQRMLVRIAGAADHMGALIDALLDLSRLMRRPLERRHVDLSALATRLIGEARERFPGRAVEASVQPGLSAVADPVLLRSALANLIDNAWKYSAKVPEAHIEVGWSNGEFYVRDNGEGFDMAYKNKLFKPFERLHAGDEFPGTGIGLATVERILRRHGGRVRAEGALGKGATIYFTLPE